MPFDLFRDDDRPTKSRVPSLVQYCQRVVNANIDAITGLGDEMPYRLVEPILQGCAADTLLRIERETPHISEFNDDIWRGLCLRSFPGLAHECDLSEDSILDHSWRDQYYSFHEQEATRLENAGNRMRNQRLEMEELKKKRQVKLTDRAPPAKRGRSGWNYPTLSKTLFQKTKAEANKIQKSVYGARMIPPMPTSKGYSSEFRPSPSQKPSLSLGMQPTAPITLKTVVYRKSSAPNPQTQSTSPVAESSSPPASSPPPRQSPQEPLRQSTLSSSPPKMANGTKKDPMSSLFMPKHRALSQLPKDSSRPPASGSLTFR